MWCQIVSRKIILIVWYSMNKLIVNSHRLKRLNSTVLTLVGVRRCEYHAVNSIRDSTRLLSINILKTEHLQRSTVGGRRAVPVAGAKVWNSPPSDVTSASSLSVFKNRIKTYLFRRCYETVRLWMTFPILFSFIFLFFPINSGPCNSCNCLGHFWHVCDDDDDDDLKTPVGSTPPAQRLRR